MLRVNQIKCNIDDDIRTIKNKTCSVLKIKETEISSFEIIRQAIDARKKPDIFFTYSVLISLKSRETEKKILKKFDEAHVSEEKNSVYHFPSGGTKQMSHRPVIVGMGPAGLFCAYYLAKNGYRPIVLERGKRVEERTSDVERFWKEGVLLPESNVQFGEGGAGTFSDGKLNTLVKDKYGRNKEVLQTLVLFGAPKEIVYQAKPHIGTDVLCSVVSKMREKLLEYGADIYFNTQMEEVLIEKNKVKAVKTRDGKIIETDLLILATGHSARDTFEMLHKKMLPMQPKPFAVGFRVTHPQNIINQSQYGTEAPGKLGAAPYKVTAKTTGGRGVYSFCMCPGGYVVNASSEHQMLAVNGMSYSGRNGKFANSAIVVSVTPKDYPGEDVLSGVRFQRDLERKAYELGKGKIPAQCYGDFKNSLEEKKTQMQETEENYDHARKMGVLGGVTMTDLTGILTKEMNQAFVEGMEQFGRAVKGFNNPDTMMYGIESRTSSPVKILRDEETLESPVKGIYPCGEGAGYAGGITSAAMDGLKVAEQIAITYRVDEKIRE